MGVCHFDWQAPVQFNLNYCPQGGKQCERKFSAEPDYVFPLSDSAGNSSGFRIQPSLPGNIRQTIPGIFSATPNSPGRRLLQQSEPVQLSLIPLLCTLRVGVSRL